MAAVCLFFLVHSLKHPFVYLGSFEKALFVVLVVLVDGVEPRLTM